MTISLLPLLIAGPVLGLVFLASLPRMRRHTDFFTIIRSHLRRFAPLYFVAGPSAITYFAACGTLSAVSTIAFAHHADMCGVTDMQGYLVQHGIFTLFHWIEITCGFLGAYAFAWIIRWVGLDRFWLGISGVSLGVTAAYRTARHGAGPSSIFESGPQILLRPDWVDVIPVVLGLVLFLFQQARADKIRSASMKDDAIQQYR